MSNVGRKVRIKTRERLRMNTNYAGETLVIYADTGVADPLRYEVAELSNPNTPVSAFWEDEVELLPED